ncbi:MAG: hypothetical protein N3F66_11080 [Spirochaetes bacterium]|nr:hypothetical protein [Spirochaetota bacterium]
MDNNNTQNELLAYRTYLENNIQYINEINKKIEQLILKLEKEHIGVKDCFVQLENQINLLLKVYSHFTSLGGYSYLLKLKSLIDKYQQVANSEIQLSALYYIHSKILALQEEQLAHFPEMAVKKALYDEQQHTKKIVHDDLENCSYKWITFKRNTMWFVVLFDSYQLLHISDFSKVTQLSHNYYQAILHNNPIILRDPLRLDEKPSPTVLVVQYAQGTYGYMYDAIGRKLGASTNILKRKAQLSANASLPLYGRVRLFGDSYIYLKHVDMNQPR